MVISFILALLPIIWLIIALTALQMPGYKACPIALALSFLIAIGLWKMPILDSITAILEGAAMSLWPIIIVIIAAVFTYNVCIHTGYMEIIKKMLAGVTRDKRVLVLIIAWGFGGFMEGMAGFGTAIAIPASMLWALGFDPVLSAIVCLIANSTPTAFGSIGIPTTTLSKVTGLNVASLSVDTVIQIAPIIILTPYILVLLTAKSKKAFKGVGLITLISGLSFVIPEYLVAKYVGPELPVVIGSVSSMFCTILAAKLFERKDISPEFAMDAVATNNISKNKALTAWLPFILIFIFLLGTSNLVKPVNSFLAQFKSSVQIYTGEGGTHYSFAWLSTPGLWIILAGFIGGIAQGAKFTKLCAIFKDTVLQMMKTIVTIMSIIAASKLMGHSGMIASIADMFVKLTGSFYPLFSPFLGSIGSFVTGSGTSASVLFGGLQAETANVLNLNSSWLAAANTAGATAGKMISPQSIAIAVGATALESKENLLLKGVIKYCAIFIILMGIISYFGAQFL